MSQKTRLPNSGISAAERKASGKIARRLEDETSKTKELTLVRPGYTFHNEFAQDGMTNNKIKIHACQNP